MTQSPSTYIVGCGAVGSSLGFFLKDFASIGFVGRDGPVDYQYQMSWNGKTTSCHFLKSTFSDQPKLFVFCVKAYSLEKAIHKYASLIPTGSTCVVISNGYIDRIYAQAVRQHSQLHWQRGVCCYGTTKKSNGVYRSFGEPIIVLDKKVNSENKYPVLSTKVFKHVSNIEKDIQIKLFVNLVVNTMSAAYNFSTNDQVLGLSNELESLSRECFDLVVELYPSKVGFGYDEAKVILHEIIMKTAGNMNSMVADIRNGRQNEKDFLSGICPKNGRYPLLEKMHRLIIDNEQKTGKLASDTKS